MMILHIAASDLAVVRRALENALELRKALLQAGLEQSPGYTPYEFEGTLERALRIVKETQSS